MKRVVVGLAVAMFAFTAGHAFAAVTLDQSDIPETGVVATGTAGGPTIRLPNVVGESFTVGLTGVLARVDLPVFRIFQTGLGATFDLLDAGGVSVFTQHLDASAIPLFALGVTDWSSAPSFDVVSAQLHVAPGDDFTFTLTPDAGDSPWTFLLSETEGVFLDYPGGVGLIGPVGGPLSPVNNTDFGFRTYVDVGSAAPEPAAWALMTVGFSAAGLVLRGARRRPEAA